MSDELDLDALLESALEDFEKEEEVVIPVASPVSGTPNKTPKAPTSSPANLNADPFAALNELLSNPDTKGEFDSDLKNVMEGLGVKDGEFSMESLQKELESLQSAFGDQATPTTSGVDSKNATDLAATVENLMKSAESLQGDGDMPTDDLMNMFKDIENNPEFGEIMETLVSKFLSKEVLYEGLVELQVKFKEWLEKKRGDGSLSATELESHQAQLDAIGRVLTIYDAADDEQTEEEAQALMKQMEEVGSLPEEVLREIGGKMPAGLGGENPQCSIM